MDRSNEYKKLKEELAQVTTPGRLDTTLNRCFARIESEQGERNKMKTMNKKKLVTATLSMAVLLSIGTISYAAVKGGFFPMLGVNSENQSKYTEYVSTKEAGDVIAGYDICIENTLADYENGMGYTYFSIENTDSHNDYVLSLRTTALTAEEEENMEKDKTKYVRPILDVDAQSFAIDEARSQEGKTYILASYSLKESDEDINLLLSECDFGGDIDEGVHKTLGKIALPVAKTVEKKTFTSTDGKEIQISPISLVVTDENVEDYYEKSLASSENDAPDLVDLYIDDITFVTAEGEEIAGETVIKKGLSKTDIFGPTEGEIKLTDVQFTLSFQKLMDTDDLVKVVIGGNEYEALK